MKKALAFLLIVSLFVTVFSFAQAEEKSAGGDWKCTVREDGTVEITRYTGEETEASVPAELDGRKVTGIGEGAFYNCKSPASVIIPDSVTSIGDFAFEDCISLTSITIPDSVTSIGTNPFSGCKQLTDIRFSPDNPYFAVTDGVVFSKPDMRLVCYPCALAEPEYTIPQGTEFIGDYAFTGCKSLASITIPDSVTGIGDGAFAGCFSLTSVTIPESVTGIGSWAFNGCITLTSVTFPESVTSIGSWVFLSCPALTSVTIPDSVTSIGENAFYGCSSVTVTVGRNSYAEQYCEENGIRYTYADDND